MEKPTSKSSNPLSKYWTELNYINQSPNFTAKFKTQIEDFIVEEDLGFEADGQGEQDLLIIRKKNLNTEQLARKIADVAGVRTFDIGYAGLKDKFAVTTQAFSVYFHGKPRPDWSVLNNEQIEVLSVRPHQRKLKTGSLKGNRFTIVLREATGDWAEFNTRAEIINNEGVPNYFGEQRFGYEGLNIVRGQELIAGKITVKNRHKRSLYLSAWRSSLFNAILSQRVKNKTWNQALVGDAMILNGSRSLFLVDNLDDILSERVKMKDIHPSGPLFGMGDPIVVGEPLKLESDITGSCEALEAISKYKLEASRRPLRVVVSEFAWEQLDAKTIKLQFYLPPGSYATAVLRELFVDVR